MRLFTTLIFRSFLASAVFMAGSIHAIDLDITDSREVNVNEPKRITVRQDIIASDPGKPVILINASLGGILIDVGKTIDTNPGPFEDGIDATASTIYIGNEGVLEGVLDNQGHIRDGVFINGTSTHENSGAYWSQGQNAGNQASLEGGYNVMEGSRSESRTFDTINIDSYSYIDYISVEEGGQITTEGDGTTAIHVDELGRVGGSFTQTTSAGTITINKNEQHTAFRVNGIISSSTGRAISILGSSEGKLEVGPNGVIEGGNGDISNTAAVAVEGSFTGTMQNQGEINTGILIQGTHTANFDAAYWSRGSSEDKASLSGGFFVVESGSVLSTTSHAIHVDENSRIDVIGSVGNTAGTGQSSIASQAPDRSAIYVHQQAELGQSSDVPAIIAANGGSISSSLGDAITVDGDFIGTVHVEGGSISASSDGARAVNFISANSPLHFVQVGASSLTTGSIAASPGFKNDWVQFHGGGFSGATIQNVDHLEISTRTTSISVTSDLVMPALTTILLEPETQTDSTGRETTIIDTENPVITVGGELDVESTGSRLLIQPATIDAHNLIAEGATLTVANAGDITRDVNQLEIEYGNPRLKAEAEIASNTLTVRLTPVDTDALIANLIEQGMSGAGSVAIQEAFDAATSIIPEDATKARQIFEALNAEDVDINQLAEDIQPDLTSSVQKSGQDVVNIAQKTVFNRVYGLRRGIHPRGRRGVNYGDQFSSGATWGQFVYSKGKHQAVKNAPGFGHRIMGFSLGVDTEFEKNSRVGVALTMATSDIDVDGRGKNENYNFLGSIYSTWSNNTWFFDSMITVGKGDNDIKKRVVGQEVKGSFSTEQWGFRFLGGLTKRFGNWDISPQSEFNFGMVRNGKYEEKGNTGFEQSVSFRDYRTVEVGSGLKLNGEYWFNKNMITPEFSLMGYYDFISDGAKVQTTYLAGGKSFSITGPKRDTFRFNTGLGLGFKIGSRWTISTSYDYNWSKHYRSDSFLARTRYEF